jgi:hypothetical protein
VRAGRSHQFRLPPSRARSVILSIASNQYQTSTATLHGSSFGVSLVRGLVLGQASAREAAYLPHCSIIS